MKTKRLLSIAAFIMVLCLISCRNKQIVSDSYAYFDFKPTLISASPSGLLTIRSWGTGPNKASAIKEAKKNAISSILFKGFDTSNSYMAQPLINEVNARERYAEYFDRFFSDGGEYENFVKETSSTDGSRIEAKSKGRQNHSVIVSVDRNSLQKQLRRDGVIK